MILTLTTMAGMAMADEPAAAGSTPDKLLLLDNLGRVVSVPTNEVPAGLQPETASDLANQIPNPTAGSSMPFELLQRARRNTNRFQFFPASPVPLMPYLASQDDYGNTAIRPGPLLSFVPLEGPVQHGKYWLSEYGFRYSLQQTFTFVSLTGEKQGDRDLGFYTADLKTKWNVYAAPENGTAGWISLQVEAKNDLESAASPNTTSVQANLGTLTDPAGVWSSVDGFRMPELAWQQSLRGGEIVAVAGMVSQRNYLDGNAYADSGRSKFLNSALIHSQVLPLAQNNYGFNLQWQPLDEWYFMLGGSVGGAHAGNAPWSGYNWNTWSVPLEIGYAPQDFFGLGPGIYRVQPFWAGANRTGTSHTSGGGVGFDFQQQLGAESPLGWFGRFGFGNASVAADAANQAGTGFVWQGPFKHLLLQRTSNDLLGTGFAWSQSANTTKSVAHENEYVWETVYVLQLTPTIKIQPDFQLIWDPVFNASHSRATVVQLQLAIAW